MKNIFNTLRVRIFEQFLASHGSLVRFLFVGSLNTAIDFSLFFIFANLLSIQPVVASIVSTGITMCFSFYLNHSFVFQSDKRKRQTAIPFTIATIFNVWGVQSLIIALVIHESGGSHFFTNHIWTLNLTAKLCGVVASFILNFCMYRYIFHKSLDGEAIL